MSDISNKASGKIQATAPVQTVFNLTTDTDNFVATQDNNVFNGYIDIGDAVDPANDLTSTFTPADTLTGFGLFNTLNLTSDDGILPSGANVSGIQTVNIRANGPDNNVPYVADVGSGWAGLQALNIFETFNAPVTVITGARDLSVNLSIDPNSGFSGHVTAATLIGSGTVHLDVSSLASLKSVNATGFTGTLIANLTGDKASYTGGAGNDIVLIDRAATRTTVLEGGTGSNSLQVGADHLGILTKTSMAFVHNFPTLLVASGFSNGSLDLSAVAPFFTQANVAAGATDLSITFGQISGAIVSGSGSLVLNTANDTALTSIDASGASGNITADLSGDNASYKGGSGNDAITIDHTPTASIDGGNGTNILQISATRVSNLDASKVSHFQTLDIHSGFTDGQTLNVSGAAAGGFPNLTIESGATANLTVDFGHKSGFSNAVVTGIGAVTLNAANVASLASIDVSGVSGDIAADLSGDNASYKGGSGNDVVTIDHSPTASIDGGAGANVLEISANQASHLDASLVKNFQTLDIANGFANGQSLNVAGAATGGFANLDIESGAATNLSVDLGQTNGFSNVTITGSGAIAVDASHVASLTSVSISGGVANTTDTIDLSGDNANFTGGSEADIVKIDHAPTGLSIDGGASGSANFLELVGDQIDLGAYNAGTLSGVKHFNGLVIGGTFLDGKTFDASAIGGNFTQFEIEGSDANTGADAQGITIVNAPSSLALKIVTSPGAPVTYDGGTTPSITLETLTKGHDVTANIINHTAASVSIQSFEDDFFNATNHLAADFTNATSLSITGFANLDMTGSSLAKVNFIDDHTAHGTLTVDITTANETIKLGVGGAVLGNATQGTVLDFGVTGVAATNGTATLGAAITAGTDLASSLNAAMVGKGQVSWFQFQGDTYIVEDVSGGHNFVASTERNSGAATDLMVKLTGLHDLSGSQLIDQHSLVV